MYYLDICFAIYQNNLMATKNNFSFTKVVSLIFLFIALAGLVYVAGSKYFNFNNKVGASPDNTARGRLVKNGNSGFAYCPSEVKLPISNKSSASSIKINYGLLVFSANSQDEERTRTCLPLVVNPSMADQYVQTRVALEGRTTDGVFYVTSIKELLSKSCKPSFDPKGDIKPTVGTELTTLCATKKDEASCKVTNRYGINCNWSQ
jgi:hypothetical protein